jgi:hypothetical protein
MRSGSTSGRHSFKLHFGWKLQRGGDAINPHMGQRGSLVKRQEAAKTAPVLRVIDP